MKKIYLLMGIFMLFLAIPGYTQVNLGIVGGINIANATVDPDQGADWKSITGLGIGVVVDLKMGEMMMLHLEPMYLQKGSKAEEGENKVEMLVDYLEIPVMLKYQFGTSTTKPYFMAGPSIGFLLDSKLKITEDGTSGETDNKDDTESIDFGIGIGAGLDMMVGKNTFFVEARYAFGMVNVNASDEEDEPDIKTKGIQIFVGFTFPLGR